MGVRKNAKFLTPAEREAFVQACVLMKADIVNPARRAGGSVQPVGRVRRDSPVHSERQYAGDQQRQLRPRRARRVRISVVASLLPLPPRAAAAELRARRHASLLGLDRSGRHDRRRGFSRARTAIRVRATRCASATSRPRRRAPAQTRRQRRPGGPPASPAGTCHATFGAGPARSGAISSRRRACRRSRRCGPRSTRAPTRRSRTRSSPARHGAVPPAAQRPARLVRRRRPHGQRRGLAVRPDVLPASLQLRPPLGDVADGRARQRVPGRRRRRRSTTATIRCTRGWGRSAGYSTNYAFPPIVDARLLRARA